MNPYDLPKEVVLTEIYKPIRGLLFELSVPNLCYLLYM